MKVVIAALLLVMVASAAASVKGGFFCANSVAEMQCLETKPHKAFCLSNGTYVCGGCPLKQAVCHEGAKQARRCPGDKPPC